MLNRVESIEFSRATTIVYTQQYPLTLPMVGMGQMSRLNARCLPITMFSCVGTVQLFTEEKMPHVALSLSTCLSMIPADCINLNVTNSHDKLLLLTLHHMTSYNY